MVDGCFKLNNIKKYVYIYIVYLNTFIIKWYKFQSLDNCGKYYHEKCLEKWPQCQWIQGSRNNVRSVVCPHHVCHLCISDNPKSSCKTHFPAEKLIRCIKCPTTYHRSN